MLEHLEDSPEAIGQRLEAVRTILGLDKKTFGGRAGISEQGYGAFENGKRRLSYEAAVKLRKTYNLPLEFMFFGKDVEKLPHNIAKEL